jgi:hypothetical protein
MNWNLKCDLLIENDASSMSDLKLQLPILGVQFNINAKKLVLNIKA